MSPQALLSRTIDPLLGVFTGCLAYYLYETNPRTALPPDQRLGALLQWKLAKRQRETLDGQSPQGEVQGPRVRLNLAEYKELDDSVLGEMQHVTNRIR